MYVRKQIVHNRHVVEDLEARGAIFVEELDEVPEGSTVVFSAHGVSPAVHEQAAHRQHVGPRPAAQGRIGAQREVGLGDADRRLGQPQRRAAAHPLQARHRRAPTYRVIGERPGGTEPLWRVEVALTLPEGQVMVLAEASGPSLRAAEQEAARVALAALEV